MILLDVNILLYAHREDAPEHRAIHRWLTTFLNTGAALGISELVLSSFLRIATHPSIFNPPSTLAQAMRFANQLRELPQCTVINPSVRHWEIFTDLCARANAKGNLVPDAYFAALAIESGSTWITTDRDYSRFPGLRWEDPRAQ